jgi:ABC-type glycerol-3-phosphate transport system substrate-binding protein
MEDHMSDARPTLGRRFAALVASAAAGTLVLAACGSSSGDGSGDETGPYGFASEKQDPKAPISVWVDSTRLAAAEAFQKANPDTPIKIENYDGNANGSNTFKTKMALYDRADSGWPDVVFTTDNNSASWGSADGTGSLAPLNKGLVPQETLDGFAKGAMDVCTIDGATYCLRNDLAQNVLWYDQKLMTEFGYDVPTTWEEYEALADKVATEHPGYIVGTAGDAWAPEIYMWAAECPANKVTGATSITVNTGDPNCVRAAQMMDKLIANETMSTLSLFGPEFVKEQGAKVLMLPGPSWYGGAVFQGTIKTPEGQIAVAPPLHWADQDPPVTGNVGGGAWWISSHSKNLEAARDFAVWVTTSEEYQADLAPGFPADTAAATKWLEKQQSSGYWANDISEPIIAAAGQVWPGWGSAAFSQEAIWAKVVQAGMAKGDSIESLLPAWQTEIENQAKVNGYSVSK